MLNVSNYFLLSAVVKQIMVRNFSHSYSYLPDTIEYGDAKCLELFPSLCCGQADYGKNFFLIHKASYQTLLNTEISKVLSYVLLSASSTVIKDGRLIRQLSSYINPTFTRSFSAATSTSSEHTQLPLAHCRLHCILQSGRRNGEQPPLFTICTV